MVKGVPEFRGKMRRIKINAKRNSKEAVRIGAGELARAMQIAAPRAVSVITKDAPLKKTSYGVRVFATAYTRKYPRGRGGHAGIPRWFEFGTKERFTKKGARRGKMPHRPFFWPTYRAFRSRLRGRITRSITKAFKDA